MALVVAGGGISAASYSAFVSTTSNPTSNWAAGTISLQDDDANAALFSFPSLRPSSAGASCIAVTSSGSLPSSVKLYATGATSTRTLSSNLVLTIEQGTGGGFGTCSGFSPLTTDAVLFTGTMSAFSSGAIDFSTGLGTWSPSGSSPETRVFRISYSLPATAPNSLQGGAASVGFTWEAQSS